MEGMLLHLCQLSNVIAIINVYHSKYMMLLSTQYHNKLKEVTTYKGAMTPRRRRFCDL